MTLKKILLVEPDQLIAKSTAMALSKNYSKVVIARTGQAAMDELDRNIFDLIVLEPQLGLHNGIELMYELRSYFEWQDLPVIIYSSNRAVTNEQFSEAWQLLGVSEVLYKPQAHINDLLSTIRQVKTTSAPI